MLWNRIFKSKQNSLFVYYHPHRKKWINHMKHCSKVKYILLSYLWNNPNPIPSPSRFQLPARRYMVGILSMRRKTLNKQSIYISNFPPSRIGIAPEILMDQIVFERSEYYFSFMKSSKFSIHRRESSLPPLINRIKISKILCYLIILIESKKEKNNDFYV